MWDLSVKYRRAQTVGRTSNCSFHFPWLQARATHRIFALKLWFPPHRLLSDDAETKSVNNQSL